MKKIINILTVIGLSIGLCGCASLLDWWHKVKPTLPPDDTTTTTVGTTTTTTTTAPEAEPIGDDVAEAKPNDYRYWIITKNVNVKWQYSGGLRWDRDNALFISMDVENGKGGYPRLLFTKIHDDLDLYRGAGCWFLKWNDKSILLNPPEIGERTSATTLDHAAKFGGPAKGHIDWEFGIQASLQQVYIKANEVIVFRGTYQTVKAPRTIATVKYYKGEAVAP
jgi:hypothetical protein